MEDTTTKFPSTGTDQKKASSCSLVDAETSSQTPSRASWADLSEAQLLLSDDDRLYDDVPFDSLLSNSFQPEQSHQKLRSETEEEPDQDDQGCPGGCKPCSFFQRRSGCSNGDDCIFCHVHKPRRARRRKRTKSSSDPHDNLSVSSDQYSSESNGEIFSEPLDGSHTEVSSGRSSSEWPSKAEPSRRQWWMQQKPPEILVMELEYRARLRTLRAQQECQEKPAGQDESRLTTPSPETDEYLLDHAISRTLSSLFNGPFRNAPCLARRPQELAAPQQSIPEEECIWRPSLDSPEEDSAVGPQRAVHSHLEGGCTGSGGLAGGFARIFRGWGH